MRPVNLIPPEERHGSQSPMRTGPLPYIVLGGLVALLVGVALLVVTDNQISERNDEIAAVKREDAAAQQKAQELANYVQLAEVRQTRMATIASLADSRFDWERVLLELSKVLPSDVWLTSLNASASPSASEGGGSGESSASGLRGSIPGPALELSGCADGQEGVAGFITALKEIDGVTRVGVQSSAVAPQGSSAEGGEGGGGGGGTADCRTRNFIAQFQLVIAFDAAPLPVATEAGEATAVEAAPEGEASEASSEETSSEAEG